MGFECFFSQALAARDLARHAPRIMTRLEHDSGLVYWNEFEHVTEPAERIRLCVQRALEAREKTAEGQRGLDPVSAIQELTLSAAILSGVCARAHDPEPVSRLLTLVDRLRPQSPAVDMVGNLLSCAERGLRGWATDDLRLRLIEQVAEPIAGFDETSRKTSHLLRVYYQALDDALVGAPEVFERSALLEQDASYEPLAWQVRMLAHLFQGAAREAERCRRKRDLALTGRSDVDRHLETSLAFESAAYVILGDLMALKRVLPVLRNCAEKWPQWKPLCLLAESAYAGIRGHDAKALELSQEALNLVRPGAHAVWVLAMTRLVRLLAQASRAEEARSLAAEALVRASEYPLVSARVDHLEMALALAESMLSDKQGGHRTGSARRGPGGAARPFGHSAHRAVRSPRWRRAGACNHDRASLGHPASK